ncbi:MAG: hypothetical protein AAFO82_00150 [Bacteroidota bacterium]
MDSNLSRQAALLKGMKRQDYKDGHFIEQEERITKIVDGKEQTFIIRKKIHSSSVDETIEDDDLLLLDEIDEDLMKFQRFHHL